jgi:hypothetical protein
MNKYLILLRMNIGLLTGLIRFDLILMIFLMLYVFFAPFNVQLTPQKGIFLFFIFVFISFMGLQTIQKHLPSPLFYWKLPLNSRIALLIFYLSFILPWAGLFALVFLILRPVLGFADWIIEPRGVVTRMLQALWTIVFIKTMCLNLLMANVYHIAMIMTYFFLLFLSMFFVSMLQEWVGFGIYGYAVTFLMVNMFMGFFSVSKIRT